MRLLIISSLIFLINLPLNAEEDIRYYDVELVVFENLEENTENNEIWPRGKQLEIPEITATLGQKFTGELPPEYISNYAFRMLSVNDYQLKEEVETLKESEKYRILLHTGWRQPGLAKDVAIPVYFTHAISEDIPEQEASVEAPDTTATPAEATPTPQPSTHSNLANLQGVIKIVLSRYLHLDVEMLYKKDSEDTSVDMFDTSFLEDRSDKEPVYYMKQNRRMRSKETHYIDHPKFSMLVRITPFKLPTPPAAPQPKG